MPCGASCHLGSSYLGLQALEQLSAADNRLTDLPPECTGLTSLRSLTMCAFPGGRLLHDMQMSLRTVRHVLNTYCKHALEVQVHCFVAAPQCHKDSPD